MKIRTKVLWIIGSAIIIAGVFVGGIYVGYIHRPYVDRIAGVANKEAPAGISADLAPFWQVWSMIDEKFPGADKISAQTRVYGAIQGLVSSLGDPYSVFFPPAESKDFQDTVNDSFSGIGLEVGIKDNGLVAIAPIKDSPADKAGIKPGDAILKIDDTATTGMSVDAAVHIIRGTPGTVVKLTILHTGDDQPVVLSITRAAIVLPTTKTEKLAGGIFVIHLYNFGPSSATEMANALNEFNATGDTNLVIDMRGNPGGYLDAAVNIASFFLPQGETVVTEDPGANGTPNVYRSKGYGVVDPSKVKIAILVDRGSASAAEILSGALEEHHAAVLIGERTYGKGSVQQVMSVTSDTTLKLTIARWLTPNGISISNHGLDPNIAVTITQKDIDAGKDLVMQRAEQYFATGK